MSSTARVTVTLPAELVQGIDRFEKNRSRFIAEAVGHEIDRRRREGLCRSLAHPHLEGSALADADIAEWGAASPEDEGLVDITAGKPVRWLEGEGWVEG